MAQQVTADAFLLGVYKRMYTDKKIRGLFFRNSPVGRTLEINQWEGQTYQFTIPYDRGGATSGNYVTAVANAASSARTAEMAVTPGNIFTVFNITQKEYLAARTKRGGYLKSLGFKLFAACEGTRKHYGASLYSYGIGDIGYTTAIAAIGAATVTVNWDTVVKMAIGTQFLVIPGTALGVAPAAAAYDAVTRTVTAIDGQTVTFDVVVGAVAWVQGSLIYILGGRDATPAPSMPTGLAGWLPYLGNRTGATWTTYIAIAYYGVVRSASSSQLAGWFVQRANGELYMDAMVRAVAAARRGGGIPNLIAINDVDWLTMNQEANTQTAMMQQINTTGAKNQPNEVARGLAKLRFAMSSSWIENIYDDPYCTTSYAWVLDKDVVEFVTYSNSKKVIEDGIEGNEPGAASAEENQEEPDTTMKLNIDDYLSITGNSTSVEGPAAQVTVAIYGNFVVREPGHCAVVSLA
jgi:hypothetical protein